MKQTAFLRRFWTQEF